MLSSQTKDQQTFAAVQRLRKHGLTVDDMIAIEDAKLQKLLYGVGFYKRKTEYIKRTSQIIKDKHDGQVPSKLKDILKFPGVGMKMALLLQQGAFGVVEGISVDTHVHRISNLLNWTDSKNADKTREQLQEWLPKDKWAKINHMLVGFGQTICKPVAPLWDDCKINDICPAAFWYSPKKKTIEYEGESSESEFEEKKEKAKKVTKKEKLNVKDQLKRDAKIKEFRSKLRKKTVKEVEPLTLYEIEQSKWGIC